MYLFSLVGNYISNSSKEDRVVFYLKKKKKKPKQNKHGKFHEFCFLFQEYFRAVWLLMSTRERTQDPMQISVH